MTTIIELIELKKKNKKISFEQFDWFIKNILNGSIADYQISSFLMSIWFNKLDDNETYFLTKAMVENGIKLSYSKNTTQLIDKHSTGGIGDKVTLIILPILASLNINIAKMSGRGLGYTGGTIDKLDSVNIKTDFEIDEAIDILKEQNFFILQQTNKMTPADKILYSIRDTSGSVDDISLIASSIMSKKIATNADYIYLDAKVGDGGFFSNLEDAKKFGKLCIKIGKKFNKKIIVHYTNMKKPLGRCLGNLIEVKEAIDFLNGNFKCDSLKKLIFEFAKDIIIDLKKAKNSKDAYKLVEDSINSKKAYNKFLSWAKKQNSNFDFLNLLNNEYSAKYKVEINSSKKGFLNFKSNKQFGFILMDLKANRKIKTDLIDFNSGIYLNKYNGEWVEKNDVILTLYSSNPIDDFVIKKVKKNIEILEKKPFIDEAILGVSK